MDLEFGQIFGSYRRDFVPIEAGMLLSDGDGRVVDVIDREFHFAGDLVLRKNSIDSLGNPIGIEETVLNPDDEPPVPFDPRYRISRESRSRLMNKVNRVFDELGEFMEMAMDEYEPDTLIFFGGQEDMNLLNRAGFDINSTSIKDLQKDMRSEIGRDLSLDKASLVIDYGSDEEEIFSRNFRYRIPEGCSNNLAPHRAVGDVARIFLLHREMELHREQLFGSARELLKRIDSYRNNDEEIPIF